MRHCHWISSDEPLLREEAADRLRRKARAQGFTRHIFHTDARFDWDEFRAQANSLSLFSEKQLIECRLDKGRLLDAGVKAVQEYLDSKNADISVVLISPKIEASAKKTKWFKNLSSQIDMQIIWPPQGNQFLQFLRQRAKHYGLTLTPEALQCLAEFTEGNLLAAKQILEQLSISHTEITVQDVQAQLHDASKYNVYQLVDTAVAGDSTKTVSIFYKLLDEGVAPALMLWALHRHLRGAQLNDMLPALARVDQLIKSQNSDEGLNELLDLYIMLSGARLNTYEIDT